MGKGTIVSPKKGKGREKRGEKKALTMLLLHPGSTGVMVCVIMVSAEGSLHLAA